jgi:hypothetical protein
MIRTIQGGTMADAQNPLKTLVIGVLFLIGGIWFWIEMIGNPLSDLALVKRGEQALGKLVSTDVHEAEDHRGHVFFSDVGVYSFQADGEEFLAITRMPTGSLPPTIVVEFLPTDPSTNRVLGDGAQSVWEWIWRKLGFGLIVLGFCIGPGIEFIRQAVLEFRARGANKKKIH